MCDSECNNVDALHPGELAPCLALPCFTTRAVKMTLNHFQSKQLYKIQPL